ncbi:MAG: hypothetical protein E7645_00890 [Ruminococcaceae bacterium]|nr:hypothetical protein [Oscillospiraceae bacterium]
MARTVINVSKAPVRNNPSAAVATSTFFKALDASAGGEILWDEKDDFVTIILQNTASSSGTAVIKCGDGPNAVEDLQVVIPASSTVCVGLDSARFKVTKGTDKGKVLLTGPATISVAVVVSP